MATIVADITLAALFCGALVASGISSLLPNVQFAGLALCAAWWLRYRHRGGESIGVLWLAASVALHVSTVSPLVWAEERTAFGPLWSRLTELGLMALVLSTARRTGREWRIPLAILLVGLPALPAGRLWVSFPMAALLCRGGSCWTGRHWPWLVAGAWACGELIRAPCRFDAAETLGLVSLACAGVCAARSLGDPVRWLPALGLSLAIPAMAGWMWYLLTFGNVPTAVGWGVNVNPLGAQTALGALILFLSARRRRRAAAWVVLAAGVVLVLPMESVWVPVCVIMVAIVSALPPGRLRAVSTLAAGSIPFISPLVVLVPATWLPDRLHVSLVARQYHWHAALSYLRQHPWGGGLGNVHPQALGLVSPPPELAVIPGNQMQHAHHFLLHVAEQGGIPLAIVTLVLVIRWLLRFASAQNTASTAGFALLFLWVNNGVDLSLTYEALVLTGGILYGTIQQSVLPGRPRRGWPAVTFMIPYGAVWLTMLLLAGEADGIRRGITTQGRIAGGAQRVLCMLWSPRLAGREGADGTTSSRTPHGRCGNRVPSLVDDATVHIGTWRPVRAESLLGEAIRLDPAGVISRGGGRARVLRSLLQMQRGRNREARIARASLHWSDKEATEARAALEFYTLRKQDARVESLVKAVLRTTHDPALRAEFLGVQARREMVRKDRAPGRDAPGDLRQRVEQLVSQGRIAEAKIALNEGTEAPWVITMLESRIAVAEGDMDRGIALAARAVAQSGGADAARFELVRVLSQGNRAAEALSEAHRLVRDRPDDPAVLLLRAQTLLNAGRAEEALHDAQQAAQHGGDPMATGIARAQALRMTGRHSAAERVLIRLVQLRPGMPWAAWELASWAEAEHRLDDAERWGRIALERAPGDNGTRVLLGRIMRLQGRSGEARRYLSAVLRDPAAGPGWREDARREIEFLRGGAE